MMEMTARNPEQQGQGQHGGMQGMQKSGYGKLGIALLLSFLVMFPLSMAFIDKWSHFHWNLSNAYMALTMVAPMGLIMMLVMRDMFPKKGLNIALVIGFVVMFFGGLWLGHKEIGVGNDQFLRAMIPHHSRAILVCQNANITDPAIDELCQGIVKTQEEEIATMEVMLDD